MTAPALTAQRPAPREDTFLKHRPLLHAIAYRMLGSVQDAEDAVQDAYLRWASRDPATVTNPAGFLTTVITRLCLDKLRSAAARRELYVGPWLPEPLPTGSPTASPGVGHASSAEAFGADPAATAAMRESASMGMLLLLEQLSPAERAVFVLREAFDLPYPQIAEIVERSPDSCRQLHHRARQHVAATSKRKRSTRQSPDPDRDRRIVEGFLAAARGGDLERLKALFREDVVLYSDGGGKVSAARNPIFGSAKAARLYTHVFPKRFGEGTDFAFTWYNHTPALRVRRPTLTFVYIFDIDENGRIAHLYMVANPDKLTHLAA